MSEQQYHAELGELEYLDYSNAELQLEYNEWLDNLQETEMAKVGEMIPSKFLKKEDVEPPLLVTIKHVDRVNVAKEGADPEYRYAMTFEELDKPLVLNSTNIQACQMACGGSDDTDDWVGSKVVLYNDPNVSFQGKITGGVRIRKPKTQAKAPVKFEEIPDDVPF